MNKKAILYYFSGTGNTRLCAQYIAKYLRLKDFDVDLYEYKAPNTNVPDPNNYEYVGVGFPIHAFNPPKAFYDFCKRLPKVNNNQKLFFFRCSGEPYHFNDAAAAKIHKRLKKKGFNLIMDKHFILPYNIMFRYKDEVCKQQYLYCEPLCELMATRLANGEVDKIKYKIRHKILSFFFRIEWIAPGLNSMCFAGANKNCIDCGRCIAACPNQAIYKNKKGKIKINTHCTMCMRCTMYCPENAIRFGFMNSWKVNGPYPLKKIASDFTIEDNYINPHTKGYFKLFYPYFKKADEDLAKYGISIKRNN